MIGIKDCRVGLRQVHKPGLKIVRIWRKDGVAQRLFSNIRFLRAGILPGAGGVGHAGRKGGQANGRSRSDNRTTAQNLDEIAPRCHDALI